VDITLNSTLNIDPLKGEKVKLKVGGEVRKSWSRRGSAGPVAMTLRAKRSWRKPGCRSIWR
jgi:translocation and assembly module TamB